MRANVSLSTKLRSSPSTSPGRCGRVVTLTECQICGWCSRRYCTTVLFPTPAGPERTVSRLDATFGRCVTGGELLLQRLPLVRAEAAYPAVGRDAQLLHDPLCPHLADAWHRLAYGGAPHLPDHVVGLAAHQDVGE